MCAKNLTKPAGVLFDLDGTLLDTAQDLGEALNHVLNGLNLPLKTYQEYQPVASHGAMGLLKLGLAEQFEQFEIEPLRLQLLEYYQINISRYTQLFNGIKTCLNTLDNAHIPWAIVTNKPAFLTDSLVTFYPELTSSKINVSGDTLPMRKPNPEPLLFACEKMQINPDNAWYVGDAKRDIEAGNRANMLSIVANWGYTQDVIPVNQWQADLILEQPDELTELLISTI
ncbi:HAD-IA family hydrolase [Catenovulum sp. 2E275]|uniref:HAD family hydrolase n=1 Tax=Catenovulum sp. 2E275 TaxID=2980497 RepID=UPI0021D19EFF|nr:HAD-IA family hydrolase [Catenovulum sp. 2E275]MCU4674485.1 HAD-IA family hydrolase [Catenovulum sp. 2E275]